MALDVKQSIITRLKSKSLYILIAISIAFNIHMENKNIASRNSQQENVREAISKLAAMPAGTESICNDGWRSQSSGPGTCSWHEGKNYDLEYRIERLRLIAEQDPEKRFKEKQSNRELIFLMSLIMSFWLSRGMEETFFPKRSAT